MSQNLYGAAAIVVRRPRLPVAIGIDEELGRLDVIHVEPEGVRVAFSRRFGRCRREAEAP